MVHRFLQAVHRADGHLIVHELGPETVRACGANQRIHVFQHAERTLVGIDSYVLGRQRRAEGREVLQARTMDDEAVQRVADAHAPRLRIEHDGLAHLQITRSVEIRVHHAGARFNAGDAGVVADKVDEPAAAARDDDVDVADGVQQRVRRLVRGGQQGRGRRGDAPARQHPLHDRHGGAVRRIRILPAFQHAGIPAFETQRENVQRHVRTGLINDADDPERHGDLPQMQPVREDPVQQDTPQRRRQRSDVPHICGNGLDTGIRQHQPVIKRRGRVHPGQILRIRAEQFLFGGYQFVGHGAQDLVPQFV